MIFKCIKEKPIIRRNDIVNIVLNKDGSITLQSLQDDKEVNFFFKDKSTSYLSNVTLLLRPRLGHKYTEARTNQLDRIKKSKHLTVVVREPQSVLRPELYEFELNFK